MFIDTHCHLDMMFQKKKDDVLNKEHFLIIKQIVEQAREQGVEKIINVGTNLIDSINSIEISKHFDNVFSAVGIHPCDCFDNWKNDFKEIVKLVKDTKNSKIIAIGEIGLDFFHKPFDKQCQIDSFKYHIELALKNNLPVIIHVRESADEVLRVVEEYKKDLKGVFHCFMQNEDFAKIILNQGFFLGIGATITYPKNGWFRDLLIKLPLDKVLLETDSPFLPPQQFRGEQNKPSYLPIIASFIAGLKKVELSSFGQITTKNATDLFKI